MQDTFIVTVQLMMALGILAIVARVPENRPADSAFFAQHKWTLKDGCRIILCLIALQFFGSILLLVWPPPHQTAAAIVIGGGSILVNIIVALGAYYFTIKRPYDTRISTFGLDKIKFLRNGVFSINIFIIFFVLLAAFREVPQLNSGASEWPIAFWLGVAILGFLGPVLEELVARGVLYAPVARRVGKWKAIMVLSLLWCLMHPNASTGQFLLMFLLGILFYHIYIRSESLSSPIILHIGVNTLSWQPMSMAVMANSIDIGIVRPMFIYGPLSALLIVNVWWLVVSRRSALVTCPPREEHRSEERGVTIL